MVVILKGDKTFAAYKDVLSVKHDKETKEAKLEIKKWENNGAYWSADIIKLEGISEVDCKGVAGEYYGSNTEADV